MPKLLLYKQKAYVTSATAPCQPPILLFTGERCPLGLILESWYMGLSRWLVLLGVDNDSRWNYTTGHCTGSVANQTCWIALVFKAIQHDTSSLSAGRESITPPVNALAGPLILRSNFYQWNNRCRHRSYHQTPGSILKTSERDQHPRNIQEAVPTSQTLVHVTFFHDNPTRSLHISTVIDDVYQVIIVWLGWICSAILQSVCSSIFAYSRWLISILTVILVHRWRRGYLWLISLSYLATNFPQFPILVSLW